MSQKYAMSLSLNVLNHLGINLYSNIPAVLSEIVANSWDADATSVNIDIFEDSIIIDDNGCGMDLTDINNHFLNVGYQKRSNGNKVSEKYKRPYMGRKGIGKLSMFSIAKEIDIVSRKTIGDKSEINAFRMNIDKITEVINKENEIKCYNPEELDTSSLSIDHDGTKIILKQLKKNTSALTAEYIKKRIARRFSIIGEEYKFSVIVCGKEVSISDRDYYHKLNYLWYYGNESKKFADYSTKAVFKEERGNTISVNGRDYSISGWIGTAEASGDLKDGDENLNKIVVLVRGKLGQEDILSEYSEGGLYSKYLIGEISADFFDDDDYVDMATTSRQSYRQDDERFIALKSFISNELKYIQGKWTDLRNESGEEKAKELLPAVSHWLDTLKGDNRAYAKKMFGKINQIAADDSKKQEIIKYGVLAFEKLRFANRLSAIENISIENIATVKEVFLGLDDLEATMYFQIIKERIEIIKKFQEITDEDMREKIIQEYLFDHLWLLDPSWERVDGTEYMEKTVLKALDIEFNGLSAEEQNARLDIGYKASAGKHIVVELKKAKRIVKIGELTQQISKYSSAIRKVLSESGKGNEPYEIICVLGRPIDNDNSPDHRQQVSESLKAFHARVVFYQELIENAFKAYNEYLQVNKASQPIIDLFQQIEEAE